MVSFGEIAGYLSYGLVFAFLDTMLFLALALGIGFVFAPIWKKDDFVVFGTPLILTMFFWVCLTQVGFGVIVETPGLYQWFYGIVVVFSVAVTVFLFSRFPFLKKFAHKFASATGPFVYLYMFFSIIGAIVVLYRNFLM